MRSNRIPDTNDTGFDAVIIHGKPPEPVWLKICAWGRRKHDGGLCNGWPAPFYRRSSPFPVSPI